MKSRTSFKPGQSGNPSGRPPNNHSLAEAIREGAKPAELVAAALEILRDGDPGHRIQALNWLAANGYSKPPERHDLSVETSIRPLDLSKLDLTTTQLEALASGDDPSD